MMIHVNGPSTLGKRVCLCSILLCFVAYSEGIAQDLVNLEEGLVITSSATVAPGEYHLKGGEQGAIRIEGDDITVDFNGAILNGSHTGKAPDQFEGYGIYIKGSSRVTIKNAVVKGYKIGLIAYDAPHLTIEGGDYSYNYRQRLKSTIEREHLDDWMSYHINDDDEWLQYGAAIYLRGGDRATVRGVTVTGGQNGLMITDVDYSMIEANEITFNSGIGIGLYRSSYNTIQSNRLDWNVRGYSHGVYYRGQDSAAILMYEQSSNNTIAYNSATHSGDGLFLWAGQTTMDDGSGGANDNLIVGNDFSFAPTNGIEVTFSRNIIMGNRLEGCWHGIWGGYSFDTVIARNTFVDNDEHIAIEHGQNIAITDNTFEGGTLGLYAWERTNQPSDWGYVQNRDTRSRDYSIRRNAFDNVSVPLRIIRTDPVQISENRFYGQFDSLDVRESAITSLKNNVFVDYAHPELLYVAGEIEGLEDNLFGRAAGHNSRDTEPASLYWPEHLPRGRKYMMVDQWGPYDYRSPVLWPRAPRTGIRQVFDIHGPAGEWTITHTSGVDSVSLRSGATPDSLTVWRQSGPVADMRIDLEFLGDEVVDRFGKVTPARDPYTYTYRHFYAAIDWTVAFFAYDAESDPREHPEAFQRLIAETPLLTDRPADLGYQWYGSPGEGVPANQFATVARGQLEVPPGRYRLDLTSDDGVRVWLDGTLVHDDWTYHPPRLAQIDLDLNGAHELRIEHFEIDGYATLVAQLAKPADEARD